MSRLPFFVAVVCIGLVSGFALAQQSIAHRGLSQANDGSFNYQGYLEENGQPANGVFYFEVHLLDTNDDYIDALFDIPGPITVVDGLFNMNIQMGGTPADAEFFWRNYGHLAKKIQISVGLADTGPFTMLSPNVDIGSTPHALWSRFAGGLQFPYADSYGNNFGDPDTMLSLTHQFGGTVLELIAGFQRNQPIFSVLSPTPSGLDFGLQNGGVQIDAQGRQVGLVSISDRYALAGILPTNSGIQTSAVIGQINSGVPGAHAIQALNLNSNNYAYLGTPSYAGEFTGDVMVAGNLRVQDEPTRDYAPNSPSPIGPLAYGSVSTNGTLSSGTANISASWSPANSWYVISVTGETMTFGSHTVSITVVDTIEPRVATFNASGGNILVKIWDINSGNVAVQDNFSIVIYDANPVVLNRASTPNGVDLDKYSEKTGTTLIETRPRYEPHQPSEPKGIEQEN